MSYKKDLSKASLTTFLIFLFSFPWYIGFYMTLQNIDPEQCDNNMYTTGTQAMWFYFSLSAYSLLLLPMNLRIYHVQKHHGRQSCLSNIKFTIDFFAIFLSIGLVLNMGLEIAQGYKCSGFKILFSGYIVYYITIWMMIIVINIANMYSQNCLSRFLLGRNMTQEPLLLV